MKYLGAVILVALFLLAVFTFANWGVLTAPTMLSFIVLDVQGPLGVILLGVTLVLAGLFSLYVLSLRTAMLMESHRHKQELQAQSKLAENAEASRLAGLRTQMGGEFAQLRGLIEQTGLRLGNVEAALSKTLDEAANGLAAHIGEIEEKLDQALSTRTA